MPRWPQRGRRRPVPPPRRRPLLGPLRPSSPGKASGLRPLRPVVAQRSPSGSSSSRRVGIVRGDGHAEARREPPSRSPAPFSSSSPGRSSMRVETEMIEEGRRRAIGDRPARRFAPAAQPDPAGLEQHVERALGGGNAADLLDLGACHRLVIGDDRERLQRRPRQLARLDRLARQQEGEVAGGAERPSSGDPDAD